MVIARTAGSKGNAVPETEQRPLLAQPSRPGNSGWCCPGHPYYEASRTGTSAVIKQPPWHTAMPAEEPSTASLADIGVQFGNVRFAPEGGQPPDCLGRQMKKEGRTPHARGPAVGQLPEWPAARLREARKARVFSHAPWSNKST